MSEGPEFRSDGHWLPPGKGPEYHVGNVPPSLDDIERRLGEITAQIGQDADGQAGFGESSRERNERLMIEAIKLLPALAAEIRSLKELECCNGGPQ